jgi:hypothetical protein
MSFSMVKSVEYLMVTLPPPIPCDGMPHNGTVSVAVDQGAPAGPIMFQVIGTTPSTECDTITTVSIIEIDIDVDSDNNNGTGSPDRTPAEDSMETSDPGKIVWVNNDDDDKDGVADKDQEPPPASEDDLVPMVAELRPVAPTDSRWHLDYDPARIQVYRSDRVTIVPPLQESVGPLSPNPSTFWVEGLAPADGTGIVLIVDLDGEGPSAPCADTVLSTVSQLDILTWNPATMSMTSADHVNIGHWGEDRATNELTGYTTGLSGTVINGAGGTFIDADPDRFMARLTHFPGNMNPAVAESIVVQVGTLTDTGTDDDPDHNVTLLETGSDTGVFESEAQLLTAPDLSMVAATDQDDGFAVYSTRTAATVADEADDDRTHKATIDGHLNVTYAGLGGDYDLSVPVCDRVPIDERKEVRIRVHVFNEPFDDFGVDGVQGTGDFGENNGVWDLLDYGKDGAPGTGDAGEGNGAQDYWDYGSDGIPGTGDAGEGNGVYDPGEPQEQAEVHVNISGDNTRNTVLGSTATATATVNGEVERANFGWTHSCIHFTEYGIIMFEDAPLVGGVNIIYDARFNISPPSDDVAVITNATGVIPNITEVFFVAPIPGATGYARVPANMVRHCRVGWEKPRTFSSARMQTSGGEVWLTSSGMRLQTNLTQPHPPTSTFHRSTEVRWTTP